MSFLSTMVLYTLFCPFVYYYVAFVVCFWRFIMLHPSIVGSMNTCIVRLR